MKYSRFVPELGLYEVFEDALRHPINADLPVPKLPGRIGNIGVPAGHAGRPLPSDAKRVGTSWRPVGQIVVPKSGSDLRGIGDTAQAHPVLTVLGSALVGWLLFRLYQGAT